VVCGGTLIVVVVTGDCGGKDDHYAGGKKIRLQKIKIIN